MFLFNSIILKNHCPDSRKILDIGKAIKYGKERHYYDWRWYGLGNDPC